MASFGWVIINGVFQFGGSLATTGNILLKSSVGVTRAQIAAPAADQIELLNAAGTGSPLLQFGGTTTSDPALKTTGTTLQVRNGQDSGNLNFGAADITSTGINGVSVAAGAFFFWTGRSQLISPANGQVSIANAATTAGVGLDITTDGTLKLRGRAYTAGTGNLDVGAKITAYNQVTTAGAGVAVVVAAARSTAQTAAVASVATVTAPAADTSYEVCMNVNVTTSTTHTFTCECAYTDETNTARTTTMIFLISGIITSISNANGAVPYLGIPLQIRAKASTSITLRTQAAGTYTTVTFNVEGIIKQIN